MKARRSARGVSLVETLLAGVITTVLLAMAFSIMTSVWKAQAVAVPITDRVWDRSRAAAEIEAAIVDAAANRAYFDLRGTIGALRSDDASAQKEPGGKGGGGGTPPPSSGQTTIDPVVSFGTGVQVGERAIVGPVVVSDAKHGMFADQVGDAVTILRTAPTAAPLRLGAPFDAHAGSVRLVAASAPARDAVLALGVGDVLLVTGRAADGTVVSVLAGIESTAAAVSVPTPQTSDGTPVFAYFELRVAAPDATLAFGLRNVEAISKGVVVDADAAVALVDRSEGLVTYYTAGTTDGSVGSRVASIVLHRLVGDPDDPLEDETLVERVASPIMTLVTWSDGSTSESTDEPPPAPVVAQRLSVRVPVLVDGTGTGTNSPAETEVLELTAELLNATSMGTRMPIWYGVFAEPREVTALHHVLNGRVDA